MRGGLACSSGWGLDMGGGACAGVFCLSPPPGHLPRASTCRAVREVAAADRRHRAKPLFRIDGPVAI